jgi:hypothetical protein
MSWCLFTQLRHPQVPWVKPPLIRKHIDQSYWYTYPSVQGRSPNIVLAGYERRNSKMWPEARQRWWAW